MNMGDSALSALSRGISVGLHVKQTQCTSVGECGGNTWREIIVCLYIVCGTLYLLVSDSLLLSPHSVPVVTGTIANVFY